MGLNPLGGRIPPSVTANQGPFKCRQGPASPQEGPAGPARAHHRSPRGPRGPHICSVLFVTSPGNSYRRKGAPWGRPGSGIWPQPLVPLLLARPRCPAARPCRPNSRGRGSAPPQVTAEGPFTARQASGPPGIRSDRLQGNAGSKVPSNGGR
ncbi:hypothetical protein NDU88_001901 [Pleurodeles waltl]|uniref:Uncharacterized protein n=1 Tax=Pleurodeles waltl TaxID=8319 RepID=A0AAV7SB56_PLEWA|nr:hypothetical protein NDU88_001901 [Pleurodeles waltl]